MGFGMSRDFTCRNCGADLHPNSQSCPACGQPRSGRSPGPGKRDSAEFESDDDFDYDDFIQREFGSSARPYGIRPVWWVTGIVLILALALFFLL